MGGEVDMSEVHVGPPPENIPESEAGTREILREAGYEIQQYTPQQFAKLILEFYTALIDLKVEKEFAEKLTIAFCQRA
jgi:hypothetical protein